MKTTIQYQNELIEIDLSLPLDISIPLSNTDKNPIAWYLDKPIIEPVVVGDWIGKVTEGKSSTNFNNISFNPHAHGTHTECLGHITNEFYSINSCLTQFFFKAKLVSIIPEVCGEDNQIMAPQIEKALQNESVEALIIRTLPNKEEKKSKKYSHTNPPYLTEAAALFLKKYGVKHLLIDLPSIDKEQDEGRLLAHKAFWNLKNVKNINDDARFDCTITEMIFVDNQILDGLYMLNLQISSFENDASPSKPILYLIKNQ